MNGEEKGYRLQNLMPQDSSLKPEDFFGACPMWRFGLFVVMLVVVLIGCSKGPEPKPPPNYYTMEKYDKIHNGMTMNEVEGVIGRWTVASPGGSSPEKYQWKRGDHEIDIDFVDGKVVKKSNEGFEQPPAIENK